jgi:hypothetical protein
LPSPQAGSRSIKGGESHFAATDAADTKVIQSEVVGGETVRPRRGNNFVRTALYHDKDYTELNGGLLKPRSKIYMSDPAHRIDYDQEGYVGFSIYTPLNFEHETGVVGDIGNAQLFGLGYTVNSSGSQIALNVYVPKGESKAHWMLYYYTGDKSTIDDDAVKTVVDLGPVIPDLGKWTDFVIRYRFNPFSTTTNPAVAGIKNARNQAYEGNKGILQVWKAEGSVDSDGNRPMALKVDIVNRPVGLVPHESARLVHRWRVYKYAWQVKPTTVRGPVWYGFDEIRQGLVDRDGTGYADVNPSGLPCTEGCGMRVAEPKPPASFVVIQ